MTSTVDTLNGCDFCKSKTYDIDFWAACGSISSREDDVALRSRTQESFDNIEIWNLRICPTCSLSHYVDIVAETQEKAPLNFWARIFVGPALIFVGSVFNNDFGVYAFGVPGFFLTVAGWVTAPSEWRKMKGEGSILRIKSIPPQNLEAVTTRAAKAFQERLTSGATTSTFKLPTFKAKQNGTLVQVFTMIATAPSSIELVEKLDSRWKALYMESSSR